MKLENSIGWCDVTGNEVIGCEKVSEGCKNCYAETGTAARIRRAGGVETWGPKGARIPVAGFGTKLRRLNKSCICDRCHELMPFGFVGRTHLCADDHRGVLRRIRVFADSNSDWLDRRWSTETLVGFLRHVYSFRNLDFLLLTKRIEAFWDRINEAFESPLSIGFSPWLESWEKSLPSNVWLGVSVENNSRRNRVGILKDIPAVVRFISFEPLLEELPLLCLDGIHWAIVGAESGINRRDCGVAALCNVITQCHAKIPTYVKQDCAFKSGQQGRIPDKLWALKQFPTVEVCR